ncbi:MAG: DUF445 domain-containing protein [Gemmatimonadota bacterium]|nr:DUF445 domain-containing protein [Gemmatimonadota bacterium]
MNKSLLTNLISLAVVGAGAVSPVYRDQILTVGLFATSGAFTNWLAVHMLFEKVPGLYGSGVVPARFKEFKAGIRTLIMEQFFTREKVEEFLAADTRDEPFNPGPVVSAVDYDRIYAGFVDVVLASPFGGMLGIVGGARALEPLRDPFKSKMKEELRNMLLSTTFRDAMTAGLQGGLAGEALVSRAETIVTRRLEELTPQMVKRIVQEMIREHLGWLVVWGGVFGGFLGLIASLVR